MVSSKLLFFYFLLIQSAYTKTLLPEFITKQDPSNLRFISQDGKFTYYQRRSGALLLGTNYTVKKILQGKIGTNYLVTASPNRKKVLITQDEHFHNFLSLRKSNKIYVTDFDGSNLVFLGEGSTPRLHLDDSRISFYNPYKKTITITRTHLPKNEYHINIMAGANPYFTPQVAMPNVNTVLFTDLNKKGLPGIVKYSRNDKKLINIYKVPTPNKKIELCKKGDRIIMGEFGLDPIESYSHISLLTPPHYKQKIIYKSEYNDVGNMVCSIKGSFIYFIKRLSSKTEVARLNLDDNSTKIISDLSHATQIIDMDSNLLLPYQGKYYILLGKNDMTQFDLLKKREEP